jgi:LDH2 family malate/lactate/ureidoglycolate dehydrogenase
MSIELLRVDTQALADFTLACFKAMGLSDEQAKFCAHALMFSELRFHPGQGQGVRRLPTYFERIRNGWID